LTDVSEVLTAFIFGSVGILQAIKIPHFSSNSKKSSLFKLSITYLKSLSLVSRTGKFLSGITKHEKAGDENIEAITQYKIHTRHTLQCDRAPIPSHAEEKMPKLLGIKIISFETCAKETLTRDMKPNFIKILT
jgi:hypothetical protein